MNGSHAAIIAAQQRRKELEKQHSEEEMSNYHSDDLDQYEFKIVRASTRRFQRPEIFQRLLQEESQAGWELLEKLDDQRVRFKRSKDMRRKDATLPPGIDPYRTQFGGDLERRALIVGVGAAVALLLGGIFVFMSAGTGSFEIPGNFPILITVISILVLTLGIGAAVARNK